MAGFATIYNGSDYQLTKCKVYTDGAWVEAIPYIYTNGSWHIAGAMGAIEDQFKVKTDGVFNTATGESFYINNGTTL